MEKHRKLSVEELNRLSTEAFKKAKKHPVIVVLDNVRSLSNVGSIFRTADSFGVQKIYLCGITGTPPDREINKTALGATESVEWKYFKNTIESIEELKNDGFKVFAVEQATPKTFLQDWVINSENEPVAFVLGNEVYGVNEEVIQAVDGCIEIPQFGTKHSLNVSVSAGIVLWHYIQLRLKSTSTGF